MLRQFLVVLVFQNGVFSYHNDLDNMVPTSTLIKLINKVVQNHNDGNLRYEMDYREDRPMIDLEYFDFNNHYYKKDYDISSELHREVEEEVPRRKEVRIHVIENPEVLERYQNILYLKRHPTDRKPKFVPKIYKSLTLEDIISHLRRNSAVRFDSISSENNKRKGERYDDDKMRKPTLNLNLNKKKQSTFGNEMFETKREEDWDITNKHKANSRERNKNTNKDWNKQDLATVEKKLNPKWDDNYPTEGNKYRTKDDKDPYYKPLKQMNDNHKYSNRKPSQSDDNYKGYKQLKFNNHSEANFKPIAFNYRPLRLSEHFKPHYKPFDSEEKKQRIRKDDYREPIKRKPVYKETNYQPKIKKNVESNYNNYSPREKRVHIDRSNSVIASGRTPIPYVGHRGVYEDK